ncbi:beta-glucoside-specific PTS transporter subunit IIABC [Corticicoccus populi]|uniref:Beta-glucoside-specific PTS transporter subunit IIABC n=1 Tax=Corticicoccus populi TaxID=1812821 RepID=A0ABW5WY34_9STAP
MKYEQLAKDIIENVGGEKNVKSVFHCVTRLRFKLHDERKVNTEVLESLEGVVSVRQSGGQYQVIVGNHVAEVYKEITNVTNLNNNDSKNDSDDNEKNIMSKLIDIISGIFLPILGILAATGMIKGLNALLSAIGLLEESDGTYQVLNIIGDGLFHFFPIFLGYTAIKRFGGTPFLGMAIGAALVYPGVQEILDGEAMYVLFEGTVFESPVYITFLGIPVILMSYATSVIPIIISTFFAAKLEGFFNRVIPSVVRSFLVPFFTLLVIVPITFMVIGPIATWLSQILGEAVLNVYDLNPTIAGLFLGGFWQVIVMFGLHWGIVPIAINNLATFGTDPILAMVFAASFAQIGAVLGVWLKTNNKNLKSLSIPAFISGIFGVTEPAIYGITLPKKRPFFFSLIGAGAGGAIIGFFGGAAYLFGGLGIFQIPAFINPEGIDRGFYGQIISIPVAFVIGFLLTYFLGRINKEESPVEEEESVQSVKETLTKKNIKNETVFSPLEGRVISLPSIEDPAFSSGALGRGVAIEPFTGKLVSPVSGVVTVLFPTYHAVGIKTDQGAEVLMHIGMDTVQLEGQYFTGHVEQGQRVEQGQLLVEFDIEKIKGEGYSLVTPLVITNTDDYEEIIIAEENDVSEEQPLIILEAEVEDK